MFIKHQILSDALLYCRLDFRIWKKKTVQFNSEKSTSTLPLWIILLHFVKIICNDISGFTKEHRWLWSLFFIFKWKKQWCCYGNQHRSIDAKLCSDCCNTLHTAWCEREFQSRKLHTHAERILDWWLCWYLSSWNWSPVKQWTAIIHCIHLLHWLIYAVVAMLWFCCCIVFNSIFIYGARSLGKCRYDLLKQALARALCHGKMELYAFRRLVCYIIFEWHTNKTNKQTTQKKRRRFICRQPTCAHVNSCTLWRRSFRWEKQLWTIQ